MFIRGFVAGIMWRYLMYHHVSFLRAGEKALQRHVPDAKISHQTNDNQQHNGCGGVEDDAFGAVKSHRYVLIEK